MLVLSRKKNERIRINDDISIVIVEIRGDKVRIGIDADSKVPVHREEVYCAIHRVTNEISAASLAPEHRAKSPVAQAVEDIGKAVEIIEQDELSRLGRAVEKRANEP
ncbi:MAG: carbon storage regulator CsrA [Opitutaceae bacterium]